MTNEQTDPTVGAQGPETPAVTEPEQSPPDIPAPATAGPTRRARVIRPVSTVARPVSGIVTVANRSVRVARRSVTVARGGAANVLARVPGTLRTTRVGAHDATTVLQTLPDSTLRSMAASSVGLGAGFYLAGAPRLAIVAGVAPAMMAVAAIVLRPIGPLIPNEADR